MNQSFESRFQPVEEEDSSDFENRFEPIDAEEESQSFEQKIPLYSSLKPDQQNKVKDIFFKMNPNIPRNTIGNLIFKFGTYLSEPEKFKPKNDFEKKLHEQVLKEGDRVFGFPSDIGPGAPGAFAKSTGRALFQGGIDIANLIPGTPKINVEEIMPISPEEMQHPISRLIGEGIGYGAPAAIGIGELREAIPAWNAIAKNAAPFLLKRLGVGAVEGGAGGAAVSKPGSRLEGGLAGAISTPLIGELIRAPFALNDAISKWIKTPDIKTLEQKNIPIEQAKEKAEQAFEEKQKESGILHEGSSTPEDLIRKTNANQQEILDTQSKIADLDKIANQNLLSQDEILTMESENDRNLKNAQESKESSEQALKDYLGEGEEHGTILSDELLDMADKNKQEISQGYEQEKQSLKNQNIMLSNPDKAFTIASDVRDLIKDGTFRGIEARNAIKNFDVAFGNKSGTIPADKFLTMLQTAKQLEYEAWQNARLPNAEGGTAQSRAEWEEKATDLSDKIKRMDKAFEQGIGEDAYSRIASLNQRWKNEVIPLRKNTNFRSLQRRQQAPGNFLNSLKGNEPGNLLIKGMIKRNPKALRAIIGQRFAVNPVKLHAPNETLNEYIEALDKFPPIGELQSPFSFLKESHAKSIENLKQAEENSKYFKNIAPGLKEQVKEKEITVTEKAGAQKRISQLQEKIAKQEKTIKELQQLKEKKNITLKEWTEIQKKITSAKQVKKDLTALIIKIGTQASLLGGGAYVANRYRSSGEQ